jgi:copper chaperone CopZ
LKPYLGSEILSILAMIVVGIPLYVCATASVPIALGFIHAGFSPGAALAFLIAGPATNAATISTTWKQLGKRSAMIYLATIAVSAIVCGLLLNGLTSLITLHLPDLSPRMECHDAEHVGWMTHAWAAILLGVLGISYLWPQKKSADSHEHDHENGESNAMTQPVEKLAFEIHGMTCSHCVAAVSRAIRECEGVKNVEIDLKTGKTTVEGVGLDSKKIAEAVKSLGYEIIR